MSCAVAAHPGPPRVAFAVGRAVGDAVTRNRVRRRLRAVVRSEATRLRPGHLYLIGAAPPAARTSYHELHDAFIAALTDLEAPR